MFFVKNFIEYFLQLVVQHSVKPLAFRVGFLLLVFFLSCQQKTKNTFLTVYIEDPTLFYAILLYQREQNKAPISIRLGNGLNTFFQLSGKRRPVLNAKKQPNLDGGLFLSTELIQFTELENYMIDLEEQNVLSSISLPGLPDNPYLIPLLLYPSIFEISIQAPKNYLQNDIILPQFQQHLAQLPLPRLLNQAWLEEQLLQPEANKNYVYLQNPIQILSNYLGDTSLQIHFQPEGLILNTTSPAQQFIQNYRVLLNKQKPADSLAKDSGIYKQNSIPLSPSEKLRETHKNAKIVFHRLQERLYQNSENQINYTLNYYYNRASIQPNSYPYLYFKGQLQHSSVKNPALQLQLERVLWAGITRGLTETQQQQALQLLSWLQSLDGQQILQQKLPQLDSENTLGIFRGLSIHPEVNTLFWRNLQLDWPDRFRIHWQLSPSLIQWKAQLFELPNLEMEHLLRLHSADSIFQSFLLPYLFLPDKQPNPLLENQSHIMDKAFRINWSHWL